MHNIPIARAVIIWHPGLDGAEPQFEVHNVDDINRDDYKDYDYTFGALDNWSRGFTTKMILSEMMFSLWHMTAHFNVPTEIMKPELLKIREYRRLLPLEWVPEELRDKASFEPQDSPMLIKKMLDACEENQAFKIVLVWKDIKGIPDNPDNDVRLYLLADDDFKQFEIYPFDKYLPNVAARVTLEGNDTFKAISRENLEVVISAFLAAYGKEPEFHTL